MCWGASPWAKNRRLQLRKTSENRGAGGGEDRSRFPESERPIAPAASPRIRDRATLLPCESIAPDFRWPSAIIAMSSMMSSSSHSFRSRDAASEAAGGAAAPMSTAFTSTPMLLPPVRQTDGRPGMSPCKGADASSALRSGVPFSPHALEDVMAWQIQGM
jgi:hypothetical protein